LTWDGTAWVLDDCTQFDYTADAPINIVGRNISLAGCALNEILKWNGSAWICAPDSGSTYTAGQGIDITGDVISLAPCAGTGPFYYVYDSGTWTCVAVPNTTPWDAACADGEVMIQVNSTGGFTCVPIETLIDVPTCTAPDQCLSYNGTDFVCIPCGQTYTAGDQIDITANVVSLAPCADGEILVYNATLPGWECVNREDVNGADCVAN